MIRIPDQNTLRFPLYFVTTKYKLTNKQNKHRFITKKKKNNRTISYHYRTFVNNIPSVK